MPVVVKQWARRTFVSVTVNCSDELAAILNRDTVPITTSNDRRRIESRVKKFCLSCF